MGRTPATLKNVLFWNMVLVVLITLGVVGSLFYVAAVRSIRQGAVEEQALLARQASRAIDASLMGTVRLLQSAARTPANPQDLAARLGYLQEARPEVLTGYALDDQGRLTAWLSCNPVRRPGAPVQLLALATRYFQAGGLFYLTSWQDEAEDDPVVLVAVPHWVQGEPHGMLVAEVSGAALAGLASGLSDDGRIRISLAAEDGRLLGSDAPQTHLLLPNRVKTAAGRAPTMEPVSEIVGNSLITVMRVPWTGWSVVVEEATREALTPILFAQWAYFFLTPLALVIASLLSVRQATRIAGAEARRIERLAVAVVEAQENERRRIAQDIHDWTAQRITSSFYHVQLLERLLAKDPESVKKELPQLATTLDHANTELREIMRNLHPHLLNELGLAAAVRELATDFASSIGLEYQVEVPDGQPEPPKHIATALFRILQEALSNVGKHASAKHLEVALAAGANRATLTIADDGKGFDPEAVADPARGEHLGLSGMRERAELLGGSFALKSSPGQGTRIEVSIGWNPAAMPPSES